MVLCFKLYFIKDATICTTAAATVRQMVSVIFERVLIEDSQGLGKILRESRVWYPKTEYQYQCSRQAAALQDSHRWRIKSREDAPIRAQVHAMSQTDSIERLQSSSFIGQPNTPAFCLVK